MSRRQFRAWPVSGGMPPNAPVPACNNCPGDRAYSRANSARARRFLQHLRSSLAGFSQTGKMGFELKLGSRSLPTCAILAILLWVAPGKALAVKSWTAVSFEQVPEDSPVWLRLRMDTVALEAAVAARWFLIKSGDSLLRVPDDGTRLEVSDLVLVHPAGNAEVTGRTWKSLHRGKVLLTLEYRNNRGTSGALDAWMGTEAIEKVFVYQDDAPVPAGSDPKPGSATAISPGAKAFLILASPLVGGLVGLMYGKLKGDGAKSQSAMNAYVYTGIAFGFWIGIQAAISD